MQSELCKELTRYESVSSSMSHLAPMGSRLYLLTSSGVGFRFGGVWARIARVVDKNNKGIFRRGASCDAGNQIMLRANN